MITLETYTNFLNDPVSKKCLLVIMDGFHIPSGVIHHFYLSNYTYFTSGSDIYPNVGFANVIMNRPNFSTNISFMTASSEMMVSTIEVDNSVGLFNSWFSDYSFAKRDCSLYLYEPSAPLEDFMQFPLWKALIEDISFSTPLSISVNLCAKDTQLNKPIQSAFYPSTNINSGCPIPITKGSVFNVQPILVDPNIQGGYYQVNDKAITTLSIYDNGVLLEASQIITNLPGGGFTLKLRPFGTITCDVTASPVMATVSNILKEILLEYAALSTTNLDLPSFTTLNSKIYAASVYVREETNLLDVIVKLLNSVNAFFYFSRAGLFTVKFFEMPVEAAVTHSFGGLYNQPIIDNSMSFSYLNTVYWSVTLSYKDNYTIQSADSLAGSITDPDFPDKTKVNWLQKAYETERVENPAIKNTYLNAIDSDCIETNLLAKPDAIACANERLTFLSKQCIQLSFTTLAAPFQMHCGNIISVYIEILDKTVLIQILSINDRYLEFNVDIVGWFVL